MYMHMYCSSYGLKLHHETYTEMFAVSPQARVTSLQVELEGSNQDHKTLAEQVREGRAEMGELEASLQRKELDLNSQIEELKVKVRGGMAAQPSSGEIGRAHV